MSIAAISSYVPTIRIASPQQVLRNLTKIAIPIIMLVSAALVREAKAVTYVECFENCDKHREAHELAKLFCYTLCAIFAKD